MKTPIHDLIEENAKLIVARFVGEARAHALPPRHLTHEEAVDHLHRYLAEMVTVLRAGIAERAHSSAAAREHGEQRWYVGYDLKSVVLEYGLFRSVIIEIIEEARGALTLDECASLDRFVNVAIADAAVEFMELSLLQVNDALRVAEKAKEARDDVLAMVSHDLKNPLNVITGSASLLARELEAAELDPKRDSLGKGVGRIQRASVTMDRLINDLLDFGRIAAGELRLDLAPCDATSLVEEAIDHATPLAEPRGVRLEKRIVTGAVVRCDHSRVLQVLANLVGNAIKFSAPGGVVTLGVGCAGDECVFEITDDGPGIPDERLPLLFKRYWQAPDTAAQGTGLGLTIAKGIVDLHGGRIWCESKVGRGSRFLFSLPQADHHPS